MRLRKGVSLPLANVVLPQGPMVRIEKCPERCWGITDPLMLLKTKRWDEYQEPDDGLRLLICRYPPRALQKKDETWDEWCKHLGPSPNLHAWIAETSR